MVCADGVAPPSKDVDVETEAPAPQTEPDPEGPSRGEAVGAGVSALAVSVSEGAKPAGRAGLVGQIVGGKWRVEGVLGRGGMGVVYEAQNVAFGKRVALKFIDHDVLGDPEVVGRFQREAQAASAVESAHIVTIFDTGTTDAGVPYLVMELLRGESLGARLRRVGKLAPSEAVHVVAQALRGLSRAHAAGVIHRDLKPDNVFLVDRDDDPTFVKILDFGISKILPRGGEVGPGTFTQKGTVLGTAFYMSPEQAQAEEDLDARTDLFSMGAILYECLTGKPPHAHLTTYESVIVAICSRDVPDVRDAEPTLPPELAAIVRRALARDRDARYPSAAAFLDALRAAMPGVVSVRGGSADASGSATSDPRPSDPRVADAPPTRTTWTSRGSAQASSPPDAAEDAGPPPRSPVRGRLFFLGITAGLVAFLATLVVIKAQGGGAAPRPSASSAMPDVTMRVACDEPGAVVSVDGVVAPDGVVRGTALSEHTIVVESAGRRVSRRVVLDGRPELRVELEPRAAVAASAPDPRPSNGGGPRPLPSGKKPVGSAGAGGAGSATGSGGAAVAAPPSKGGLQLKVDP